MTPSRGIGDLKGLDLSSYAINHDWKHLDTKLFAVRPASSAAELWAEKWPVT